MKTKFGSKILAVILSLVLAISGLPMTVAVAAEPSSAATVTSETSGVTLSGSEGAYTISGSEVIEYSGTQSELDVLIKYNGEENVKKLTVNGTETAYSSEKEGYPYKAALSMGDNEFALAWTHEEADPENTEITNDVDETESFKIKLTEDNVKKNSVTFKCGDSEKIIKYVPGETYAAHKTEAESILIKNDELTYSYTINWDDSAANDATFTATSTRNTFVFSDVNFEVKLLGDKELSGVTASASEVKSKAADSPEITDKAYINGTTTFKVSLDNSLYKVYSVKPNNGNAVKCTDGAAEITFQSKPSTITVYAIIDETKFELNADTNKHFTNTQETVKITTSQDLGIDYSIKINGTDYSKSGEYTVKSSVNKLTAKLTYDYGVDGVKLEKTLEKDDFFKTPSITIVPDEAVDAVNENGTVYYKASGVTVTSNAPLPDLGVAPEEGGSNYVYKLGQGTFDTGLTDVEKIVVDNVAPAISINDKEKATVATKENFAAFNADKEVKFTVNEAVSGNECVTVKYKNITTNYKDYFVGDHNDTVSIDKNGDLTITAKDKAGNESTETITIVNAEDKTAPVIEEIIKPETVTNEASKDVTIKVSDTQSGVNEVKVNGNAITDNGDGTFTYTATENGTYTVTATDVAGNATNSTFTVDVFDREAPSAALNSPSGVKWYQIIKNYVDGIFKKTDSSKLKLTLVDEKSNGENDDYSDLSDKAYYYLYTLDNNDLKADGTVDIGEERFNSIRTKLERVANGEEDSDVVSFDSKNGADVEIEYGENVVFVYAKDIAGNVLYAYSDGLVFDNAAPTVKATITEGNAFNETTRTITEDEEGVNYSVNNHPKKIVISVKDTPQGGEFVSGLSTVHVKVTYEFPGVSKKNYEEDILSISEKFSMNSSELDDGEFTYDLDNVMKKISSTYRVSTPGYIAFEITAHDMCENTTTLKYSYNYDDNPAEIGDLVYNNNDGKWSDSNVLTISVSDKNSLGVNTNYTNGIKYFVVSKDKNENELTEADFDNAKSVGSGEKGPYKINDLKLPDGDYDLYLAIRAEDPSHNKTYNIKKVHIKRDTVAPTVEEFVVDVVGDTAIEKVIRAIKLGTFANEAIKVSFTVKDEPAKAPDAEIAALVDYSSDAQTSALTDPTSTKATFTGGTGEATITKSGDSYYFELPYTDKKPTVVYENIKVLLSDELHTNVSSELENENTRIKGGNKILKNVFELESNPAVIKEVETTQDTEYRSYKEFHNGKFKQNIEVSDGESGINNVTVTVNGNSKEESKTVSYVDNETTGKTDKKTYTYVPEKGAVKDSDDPVISKDEIVNNDKNSDDHVYKISFKAQDNALNDSENSYTYHIDSSSPRVKIADNSSTKKTKDVVTNENVEITFDVTEDHFFGVIDETETLGNVAVSYKYNRGDKKTIAIGGTVLSKSEGGVTLAYDKANQQIKLTFSKDGMFGITEIKVADLLENTTTVDIDDIDEEFIIDTMAPSVESVTLENVDNDLKSRFQAIKYGVFSKDAVKVTVKLNNDTYNNIAPEFAAKLDNSKAKLYIYDANKYNDDNANPDDFDFTVSDDGWTLTYIIPLNTKGRLRFSYADIAGNKSESKVNKDPDDETKNSDQINIQQKGEGIDVKFSGTELESNFFLSENVAPSIDIIPGVDNSEQRKEAAQEIEKYTSEKRGVNVVSYVKDNGDIWFNDDVVIPITVEDPASVKDPETNEEKPVQVSGVYSVKITVNDKPYKGFELDENVWEYKDGEHIYKIEDPDIDGKLNTDKHTFYVNTKGLPTDKEGKYEIKVVATDFATNTSQKPIEDEPDVINKFTVYKDVEAPQIHEDNFKFVNSYTHDYDESPSVLIVDESKKDFESKFYEYFFQKETKVRVYVTDRNRQKDEEGSTVDKPNVGVKSVTLYTVDYAKDSKNPEVKPFTENVKTDGNGQVYAEFTVKANFKGALFAFATDLVENTYDTDQIDNHGDEVIKKVFEGKEIQVVTCNKTITETEEHHKAEADHVKFEALPATDYKDAAGYKLYSKSISVKVTIKDKFAGVEEGEVKEVIRNYKAGTKGTRQEVKKYKFFVNNVNSYKVGSNISGWTVEEMDGNLVTVISRTIKVSTNSNNLKLEAKMKDRDHNTANGHTPRFSIDKTNPKVVVSYDNNKAANGEYFNANRTATIKVTERNFNPDLFNVMVSDNKGSYGKNETRVNVKWSPSNYGSNTNKEGTVYTATVPFNTDGHYTLSVNGVDRVHRKAAVTYTGTAPQKFTIDKTAPVVTVTYTNPNDPAHKQPTNGNYYSKTRTAHIEVREHNWNEADFDFLLKINNGGVQHKKLNWTNRGDIHTATYDADSKTGAMYTLDFTCKDRATNAATFKPGNTKDYKPEVFFVDQTAPKISFLFNDTDPGEDNLTSTTNGSLASSATHTDTYENRIEVVVKGQIHGNEYERTSGKSVDIAEIIESIAAGNSRLKDDYYTIEIAAYDKSENKTTMTRHFAVNRNGSIFTLNKNAAALSEKQFTNDEKQLEGLVIEELNVDPVNVGKTKLVVNMGRTAVTLENGKDYTANLSDVRGADGYFHVTYTLKPEVFKNESFYKVLVTTKDKAGNTSKNSNKKWAKDPENLPILRFFYDKTAPELDSDFNLDLSMQNSVSYSFNQSSLTVTLKPIDDNSGINPDSLKIMVDGKEVKYTEVEKDGVKTGEYQFVLKGINEKVSIKFTDNAGNDNEKILFERITVSTNPFVRFFANTPLFIGVLVGIVALAIFIIILIAKRRKKDDEEENPEATAAN